MLQLGNSSTSQRAGSSSSPPSESRVEALSPRKMTRASGGSVARLISSRGTAPIVAVVISSYPRLFDNPFLNMRDSDAEPPASASLVGMSKCPALTALSGVSLLGLSTLTFAPACGSRSTV